MFGKIEKYSKKICFVVLLCSLLLKLFYGLAVPFDISPHDLWEVSDWNTVTIGNLGYVQFLYRVRALPNFFDGQFYHPPFFYILSALIMGIVYGPTNDISLAFEWIQEFNLIIAFLVSLYSCRLLELLNIKGLRLVAGTIFFCGLPLLYNMGACINNDCLMSLLCVMTVYYVLKWEKKYSWADIIKAALSMGLAMFTKTSAGLIAPAIAVFFIYKLIKPGEADKKRKTIILQYLSFGIISIPIGLFWIVRQKIKCGMPFNYIMMPLIDKTQEVDAISSASLWQRLGFPAWHQMTNPYTDYSNFDNSSNIWGQFIQSTLFDEEIFNDSVIFFKVISIILIWLFASLMIFLVLRLISFTVSKKASLQSKLLLLGIFAVLMLSFIKFCFEYPYVCTMNTRYIYCVFPVLITAYGLSPKLIFEKSSADTVIEKIEFLALSVFGVLCAVLYMFPIAV